MLMLLYKPLRESKNNAEKNKVGYNQDHPIVIERFKPLSFHVFDSFLINMLSDINLLGKDETNSKTLLSIRF